MSAPTPGLHNRPRHFLAMGLRLVASGLGDKAVAFVRQSLAARPDPLLRRLAEMILTTGVPTFHRSMLQDQPRNAAYRDAIERTVAGRRVLDIGTGSGLLAMMAARAGAAQVYACEANPMLAATAREIISANGLANRITVFAAHSTTLDRERDLGGGVDVVVSELFSRTVIGEGVLASLADARNRLCAPGATFLPHKASVRVCLASLGSVPPPLGGVEGFDLAPFSKHLTTHFSTGRSGPAPQPRSEPADLFVFDFSNDRSDVESARVELQVNRGSANGVAQWLRFEFAPGIVYENGPEADAPSHWGIGLVPFDDGREVEVGEHVAVHGWHDQTHLAIWA